MKMCIYSLQTSQSYLIMWHFGFLGESQLLNMVYDSWSDSSSYYITYFKIQIIKIITKTKIKS